jgi:kynurenine 3-monooxygenase
LLSTSHLAVREDWLDHDYKELTIPPVDGIPALEPNALHIWPRGGFMLIALPNTDQSFTATLFLARTGPRSFASLPDSQAALDFFLEEFPDAVPLIPSLTAEFQAHPAGQLGTVHVAPWRVGGQVLLLGDAAHAIVPFHGQGMNAAFEDCVVLDSLLDQFDDWGALFAEFERVRRPNAAAIAQMALENYTEMRDTVRMPASCAEKPSHSSWNDAFRTASSRATRWSASILKLPTRKACGGVRSKSRFFWSWTAATAAWILRSPRS